MYAHTYVYVHLKPYADAREITATITSAARNPITPL